MSAKSVFGSIFQGQLESLIYFASRRKSRIDSVNEIWAQGPARPFMPRILACCCRDECKMLVSELPSPWDDIQNPAPDCRRAGHPAAHRTRRGV